MSVRMYVKSVMRDEPIPALLSDVYCLLTRNNVSFGFVWSLHQLTVHHVTR